MNNEDHSVAKFYTNLWLNAAIGGGAFLSFCMLRRFGPSGLQRFFNPFRRKSATEEGRLPELDEHPDEEEDPQSVDTSFLHWAWRALGVREADVFSQHGEDGVMYIRFLRVCFMMCLVMMVVGCAIILPINFTANDDDRSQRQDMGVLTMSNIPKRSDRFMAHIAVTYFYSFLFYGVIMWTFKRYTALRTSYLTANCVRAYTLLLRGIPSDLLGKKVLRRWFEARLNASVVAVNFVWSAGRLDSLKEQRSKLLVKLEKAEMQADRTIYTRRGIFEMFGEKVEAADFYKERIEQLDQEISCLQQEKSRRMEKSGAGFVTLSTTLFNRMKMVAFADPTSMTISPAPAPSDVNWKQVDTGYVSHLFRMGVITLILVVISLAWTIPQTLIVSVANLSTLQEVSGFEWVADSITYGIRPTGLAILEGFLPAVVITLLLILVKHLFKLAYTRFGGLSCYSLAEWYAMIMYSFFLFLNVFLVVAVEGTFFLALAQIVEEPSEMVSLLANSLPQQALFFIIFIMVQGIGRLSFQLFRFVRLIRCAVKWCLLARPITPSERRDLLTAGDFDFVSGYSNGLLIFTITLCYSVMAPLIAVFGFLFFALSLLIDGYNLHRATEQRWQGGGKAFSFVLHHLMVSCIVFQVVMIGILSLSEYGGGVALVPLPFLTAALWFVLHFGWSHVINYGPVDAATETTWRDTIGETRMTLAYRQPALAPLGLELKSTEEAFGAGVHAMQPRAEGEDEDEDHEKKSLSDEFEAQHMRFFPESDEAEPVGDSLGLSLQEDR